MLKTLSAYIGEYKKVSIKTPIYIIVEVLMEILIPFVTASIIDKGIQAGAERKEKLTEAGYDYSKVQRKVNQMIK